MRCFLKRIYMLTDVKLLMRTKQIEKLLFFEQCFLFFSVFCDNNKM